MVARVGRWLESTELRLLLVDDDPAVLRAYSNTLLRQGAQVETASNGRAAVDRLRDGAFDVVVSDISMPEMSGIEFLMAVRAHDLDVPVILMTGEPSLESAMRAVEYGAFHYLSKPVAPQQLWNTVVRASRLRQLARLKEQVGDRRSEDSGLLGERAALEVRFASGLHMLWMAFQPVVAWRERRIFRLRGPGALGRALDEAPGAFGSTRRSDSAACKTSAGPFALAWPMPPRRLRMA